MGITPRFTQANIQRELLGRYQSIERSIIRVLQRAGELFVTDARDALKIDSSVFPKGDFTDRTGNLRSSIGYFVLKDGAIVDSGLEGTAEGMTAARAILGTIPNKQGYQLVGVAGMDYASMVESRGYNVITSQGDLAIVNIGRMLDKYKERMNQSGTGIDFDIDNLMMTVTR